MPSSAGKDNGRPGVGIVRDTGPILMKIPSEYSGPPKNSPTTAPMTLRVVAI